jgi:hypothetical protein
MEIVMATIERLFARLRDVSQIVGDFPLEHEDIMNRAIDVRSASMKYLAALINHLSSAILLCIDHIQESTNSLGRVGKVFMTGDAKVNNAESSFMNSIEEFHKALQVFQLKVGVDTRLAMERIARRDEISQMFNRTHELLEILGKEVPSLKKNTERIHDHQLDKDAQEERQKILGWLSEFDFNEKHVYTIRERTLNTGNWLLESPQFQNWLTDKRSASVLCCPGEMAAGKTYITSSVIDKVESFSASDNIGVSFMYFEYIKQSQQSAFDVAGCLLKQWAHQQTRLSPSLLKLYSEHQKFQRPIVSLPEYVACLRQTAEGFSRAFIILDALDECESRAQLQVVSGILAKMPANVSVFITYRSYRLQPDIAKYFPKVEQLEIFAPEDDLRRYRDAMLDETEEQKPDAFQHVTKEEICRHLPVSNANGKYLPCGYVY